MSYVIADDHVESTVTAKLPITGTFMGAILGVSNYKSEFQAAAELIGIYDDSFKGNDATRAGQFLEPILIEEFRKKNTDDVVVSGHDLYPHAISEGAHRTWVNMLSRDMFAGNIDGAIIDGNTVTRLLECKTSQRVEDWVDENNRPCVPRGYYYQGMLYCWLLGIRKATFILGILTKDEQKEPRSWTPDGNVYTFDVEYDAKEMEDTIEKARQWYLDHVCTGKTPAFDRTNKRDVEVLNYLDCLHLNTCPPSALNGETREKASELMDLMNEIIEIRTNPEYICMANTLAEFNARIDELKNGIKSISETLPFEGVSLSAYGMNISTGHKNNAPKYDVVKMKSDGIDVEKYLIKTTSTVVYIREE